MFRKTLSNNISNSNYPIHHSVIELTEQIEKLEIKNIDILPINILNGKIRPCPECITRLLFYNPILEKGIIIQTYYSFSISTGPETQIYQVDCFEFEESDKIYIIKNEEENNISYSIQFPTTKHTKLYHKEDFFNRGTTTNIKLTYNLEPLYKYFPEINKDILKGYIEKCGKIFLHCKHVKEDEKKETNDKLLEYIQHLSTNPFILCQWHNRAKSARK